MSPAEFVSIQTDRTKGDVEIEKTDDTIKEEGRFHVRMHFVP